MNNQKVIQSTDPDTDTLKCPKCGVIWRSKGYYDYDEGGWVHEEEYCPSGCLTNILRNHIKGKVIPRK